MFVKNPPANYFDLIAPLPDGVTVLERPHSEVDFIHLFATRQSLFKTQFVKAKKILQKDGMLWASWPKKASRQPTDLDENVIRDFGLRSGLVDVKVCAVDEVWSGLKFVFRVKDR